MLFNTKTVCKEILLFQSCRITLCQPNKRKSVGVKKSKLLAERN